MFLFQKLLVNAFLLVHFVHACIPQTQALPMLLCIYSPPLIRFDPSQTSITPCLRSCTDQLPFYTTDLGVTPGLILVGHVPQCSAFAARFSSVDPTQSRICQADQIVTY